MCYASPQQESIKQPCSSFLQWPEKQIAQTYLFVNWVIHYNLTGPIAGIRAGWIKFHGIKGMALLSFQWKCKLGCMWNCNNRKVQNPQKNPQTPKQNKQPNTSKKKTNNPTHYCYSLFMIFSKIFFHHWKFSFPVFCFFSFPLSLSFLVILRWCLPGHTKMVNSFNYRSSSSDNSYKMAQKDIEEIKPLSLSGVTNMISDCEQSRFDSMSSI